MKSWLREYWLEVLFTVAIAAGITASVIWPDATINIGVKVHSEPNR